MKAHITNPESVIRSLKDVIDFVGEDNDKHRDLTEVLNLVKGFKNWSETHFEVVTILTLLEQEPENEQPYELLSARKNEGTTGVWELAGMITDEFEELNKGREWDGEFYEEVEAFVQKRVNDHE